MEPTVVVTTLCNAKVDNEIKAIIKGSLNPLIS